MSVKEAAQHFAHVGIGIVRHFHHNPTAGTQNSFGVGNQAAVDVEAVRSAVQATSGS
jgi:hypothetical protein